MKLKIDINVCRVCMSSDCDILLFSEQGLLEKFSFLTQLEATPGDGLPCFLCDKCIARLKIAFDFKKQSHNSDIHFRQFIERVNSQFDELPSAIQEESPSNAEVEILRAAGIDVSTNTVNKPEMVVHKEPLRQEPVVTVARSSVRFMSAVKIVPQSTAKPVKSVQPSKSKIKSPIQSNTPEIVEQQIAKVEEFEIAEDSQSDEPNVDDIDNTEEEVEETLEEYHTTVDQNLHEYSQQVVYISLNDKNEFAFSDTPQPTTSTTVREQPARMKTRSTKTPPEEAEKSDSSGKLQHFCYKCSKGFSTKTNLWRHTATHDGHRPYQCTICGKGFTQNGSLKQHMLLHTGEKPYKCNVCERAFTQAKSLTFHMRRHTGEKPFTCEKCGISFRQKDGMKRHVLLKHSSKESPREIFSCDICSKVLFSRYSLTNHKKKHAVKTESNSDAVVVNCAS